VKWVYQWPVSAREIRSADDEVLAFVRLASYKEALLTTPKDGGKFQILGRPGRVESMATGELVLSWTGESKRQPRLRHQAGQPFTVMYLQGGRWLRFPVRGTTRGNAVMTAVDQTETEVMWFRIAESKSVEVVISPDRSVTPEVLCAVTIASPLIGYYFVGLPQGSRSQVIQRWQPMP
jgi:hypothetical protein